MRCAATPVTQAQADERKANAAAEWDYLGPGDDEHPFEWKVEDRGFLRGRMVAVDYATTVSENLEAELFAKLAFQHYAAARFAMYAQQSLVCGNLFHHAVEMAVKAGLARNRDLDELKYMGHDLKTLWRAFKNDYPDASLNLARHNKTVSTLNKVEDIRYPRTSGSIAINMSWSGDPGTVTTFGGLRTPKKYPLVVCNIDDLFADIFRAIKWDPLFFVRGQNNASLEAIRRENNQSEYLTKQPMLPYQPPVAPT